MKPKWVEREEARRLRSELGMPMKRIARRLGVSVNSVHRWTKDIELTPEQRERNRSGPKGPQSPERIRRRTEAIRRTFRDRRLACQDDGREAARCGDAFHQAGCMLYWAEGSKDRNQVGFCNSDPDMVRLFKDFILAYFDVALSEFRLSIHVYLGNGLSLEEVERFWLDQLGLPDSVLRKTLVNPLPTSSSGKKKNKLPYGVCALTLGRTEIVQHIYGAIQEYACFDEPRWLDGTPRKPRAPKTA